MHCSGRDVVQAYCCPIELESCSNPRKKQKTSNLRF